MNLWISQRLIIVGALFVSTLLLSCVLLLVLIPATVDRVYEVAHGKVSQEENALVHSARSFTTGVREVASNFDMTIDKGQIEILSFVHQGTKIMGKLRNNAAETVYGIQITVVIKDADGTIVDVLSDKAQGFGSLPPGDEEYFYMTLDELVVAEGHQVSGSVVQATKSFLKMARDGAD